LESFRQLEVSRSEMRDAFAGFGPSVNILEDVATAMPWVAAAQLGKTGSVPA